MDKIVFEDLPSKNTPINAKFLNQLQDNFEKALINCGEIAKMEGTAETPINANNLIEVGIYRITGTVEYDSEGNIISTGLKNFYIPKLNNISNWAKNNQSLDFILIVTSNSKIQDNETLESDWEWHFIITQTMILDGQIYIRKRDRVHIDSVSYTTTWSEWEIKSSTSEGIGGDTLPIGTILPYGSDTIPDNYLLCKGQELPRAEFRELFNIIGTTYGEGDGSTTFALPNLCGKVPVGKDSDDTDFDTLGNTGGEKEHKLTASEMATLTYDFTTSSPNGTTTNGDYLGYGTYDDVKSRYYSNVSTNAGDQPHNNLQPYIVTNYIIKVKMGASLTGQVIDSLDSDSTTDAPSINAVNEGLKTNIITGEESSTNEYIDGKQVFVKRISFTFSSDTTTWQLLDTIEDMSEMISVNGGFSAAATEWCPIPCINGTDEIIKIYANPTTGTVYIRHTYGYASEKSGYLNIYYTKN